MKRLVRSWCIWTAVAAFALVITLALLPQVPRLPLEQLVVVALFFGTLLTIAHEVHWGPSSPNRP